MITNNNPMMPRIVFGAAAALALSCSSVLAEATKWDYTRHPVKLIHCTATSAPYVAREGKMAFDGYGAQGSKPAAIRAWQLHQIPTAEKPAVVEIDYGQSVAVSCFVNYFYVPGSRDMRYISPAPSAFKTVRISSKNDGEDWSKVVALKDLPISCPQKLITNSLKSSRYWRIEILELVPGAEMLCSYEIETWLDGIPEIKTEITCDPDFPAEFANHLSNHKASASPVCPLTAFQITDRGADLNFKSEPLMLTGVFVMQVDGQRCAFQKIKKDLWRSETVSGTILLNAKTTKLGLLLNLTFNPGENCTTRYQRASVQLSADNVNLYYIPAYVWNPQKPADMMVNACNVQTRLAGLGTQNAMLLLIPGTDRGNLGFVDGKIENTLLLGEKPTPILITAVRGDWWSAYQFAVKDVYDFKEQPQTVPVSEIQYGISRYILRDDVWDQTLGTMRAWPSYDPCAEWFKGFDAHAFYGAPYSIPAYWARYVMNGDPLALERCQSIVNWLMNSGVRMKEGPAKGAFFSLQRFKNKAPAMDHPGSTQANGPWLTSQSTGAAMWSLLFYRKTTGDANPQINQVIQEAATWLLNTQKSDGGWPYEHDLKGIANNDDPPSSGAIWNIWSLWRLGKETGDSKYLDAAKKGTQWFQKTFVTPHHYHGYWEDVGWASREGYEAAVAAVAFGEMGEKDLVVETAKDAVQWVFTRQIECREQNCSAGLVAEQTGWPPAAYCNPMMGLAAWTAWQTTHDDFWIPFARMPKAIGWWYQPETGAIVWIVDSTEMAPIVGPSYESWWTDWNNAQIGTLTLRWLVREANLRSGGKIAVDEELLAGKALNRDVKLWSPPGGLHPTVPLDGQINWLGFRSDDSILIALTNYGKRGLASCPLDSRDVEGATLCPIACYTFSKQKMKRQDWNGEFPVKIGSDEMVILEWSIRR